jgi:formate dehydrogenase major subunit
VVRRGSAAKDQVDQKDNVRAMFVQGHASNSITRIPESLKGLQKLDLLVVADPHPTTWASLAVNAGRKDNMNLLPACTQFEASGSRVASNRSIQWGEQIVKPIFESKNDLEIIYLMAKKFGFADKMFKNIKVENNLPLAEDVLREMNRGSWSTGYWGQSPERLKLHMANQKDFDLATMRAKDGPAKGDYYGLPWPCWGKPEVKHRPFSTTRTCM